MTWREDYPKHDRPDDDAPREIWWIQGGIPIARQALIKKEDGGYGEWSLGDLEPAFFGGRGVELCWWLWARDKVDVTDRYKEVANQAAERLEKLAASLREVGK